MPVRVEKRDNQYCVVDPQGKLTGKCYSNKKDAVKQVQAINLSMRRQKSKSGLDLAGEEKVRMLAADLNKSHGVHEAPIVMMSDGSAEGTVLFIYGQLVQFKSMDVYCDKDEIYPSCSMSITVHDTSPDGMKVEKTLRLRKEQPPAQPLS